MRLSNCLRVLFGSLICVWAAAAHAQSSQKLAQATSFQDQRQLPKQQDDASAGHAKLQQEVAAQKKAIEQLRAEIEEERRKREDERRKRIATEASLKAATLRAEKAEEDLGAAQAALQKYKQSVEEQRKTARSTPSENTSQQQTSEQQRPASPTTVDKPKDSDEAQLAGRLTAALDDARRARLKADKPQTPSTNLPDQWAEEERKRLLLEEKLRSAATANAAAAAAARNPIGKVIKLKLKGSSFQISGILKSFNRTQYVITPPDSGDITVPADRFDCVSDICPTLN